MLENRSGISDRKTQIVVFAVKQIHSSVRRVSKQFVIWLIHLAKIYNELIIKRMNKLKTFHVSNKIIKMELKIF